MSEKAKILVVDDTPPNVKLLADLLDAKGFEVAVVKDATAAAIVPEGDGYAAALTNFRFLASAVWTTNEAKAAMQKALASK